MPFIELLVIRIKDESIPYLHTYSDEYHENELKQIRLDNPKEIPEPKVVININKGTLGELDNYLMEEIGREKSFEFYKNLTINDKYTTFSFNSKYSSGVGWVKLRNCVKKLTKKYKNQ